VRLSLNFTALQNPQVGHQSCASDTIKTFNSTALCSPEPQNLAHSSLRTSPLCTEGIKLPFANFYQLLDSSRLLCLLEMYLNSLIV